MRARERRAGQAERVAKVELSIINSSLSLHQRRCALMQPDSIPDRLLLADEHDELLSRVSRVYSRCRSSMV